MLLIIFLISQPRLLPLSRVSRLTEEEERGKKIASRATRPDSDPKRQGLGVYDMKYDIKYEEEEQAADGRP